MYDPHPSDMFAGLRHPNVQTVLFVVRPLAMHRLMNKEKRHLTMQLRPLLLWVGNVAHFGLGGLVMSNGLLVDSNDERTKRCKKCKEKRNYGWMAKCPSFLKLILWQQNGAHVVHLELFWVLSSIHGSIYFEKWQIWHFLNLLIINFKINESN